MGKIKMGGQASREVAYDTMEISMEFNVCEESAAKALAKIDKQVESFLKLFTDFGYGPECFKLSENTTRNNHYSDTDMEDYTMATRTLKIRMPFNVKMINTINQVIVEKKLDVDISTEFIIKDIEKIRRELALEAVHDSKLRAERLAETVGTKIIGIAEVESYNCAADTMDWMVREDELCTSLGSGPKLSDKLGADVETVRETVTIVWKTPKEE